MDYEALTNEQVYALYETDVKAYIAWLKSVSEFRFAEFLPYAMRQQEIFLKNIADQFNLSTKRTLPRKN